MIESVAGETIAPPSPAPPERDQPGAALREAAHQRAEREQRHPGDEDLSPAEHVAARPPRSRKPPKASEYAVMTHWSVDCESSMVLGDRGQRDVDDRDVEHDHEERRRAQAASGGIRGERGLHRRRLQAAALDPAAFDLA